MSLIELATGKRFLQVGHDADDLLIQLLLDAGEEWVTRNCGIAFIEAEHIDYLDGGGVSLWPKTKPVIAVSEVYDMEGAEAESTDNYAHRAGSPQIVRDGELRWLDGRERWRVTYTAGYAGNGADSIAIPAGLTLALLGLVKRAYDNKGGMLSEAGEGYSVNWQDLLDSDIRKELAAYGFDPGVG